MGGWKQSAEHTEPLAGNDLTKSRHPKTYSCYSRAATYQSRVERKMYVYWCIETLNQYRHSIGICHMKLDKKKDTYEYDAQNTSCKK